MSKFKKEKDQLVNLVEKWAFSLKYAQELSEEDLKLVVGSDQIIAQAYQEINRFNWTKEGLAAYEESEFQQMAARNTIHTAYVKGIKQVMEQVIKTRKGEIARGMLADHEPIEKL